MSSGDGNITSAFFNYGKHLILIPLTLN